MRVVSLDDAVRSGIRLPASHLELLAVYLLGLSLLLAARAPLVIGAGLTVFILERQGRFAPLLDALGDLDPTAIQPGEPLPPTLQTALEGLITPLTIGILASATTATVIGFVVGQAAASAGGITAIVGELDGPQGTGTGGPLRAAIDGIGHHTWTFVGLGLVRGAALFGIPAVAFLLSDPLPPLVGSLLILIALPGGPLLYFALGFGEQVAVIEGRGTIGALVGSLSWVRSHADAFVGYLAVGFVALVVVLVSGMVLEAIGISSLLSLVVLVVAPAAFDGFKTALYTGWSVPEAGAESEFEQSSPLIRGTRGVRRGLIATGAFTRRNMPAVGTAGGLLTAGAYLGYRFTARFGRTPLGGTPDLTLDPTLAIQLWGNNWLVAATTALGGLAAGIPPVTTMFLNGFFIGAVAGIVDPSAFLALVAPHGIIELPAIAIAGGLGLRVGYRAIGTARGRRTADAMATDLRMAMKVLVGLAVLLFAAAVIEALVTPIVGNAVL